jgi:multimeric flavodoxin WrbA
MSVRVLGISASPRANSNSDILLCQALAGAESAGASVEYIRLCDFGIAPCSECNACYATGVCVIKDDYQKLSAKLLNTQRLIFATPVFFMNICAQAKALIDRAQCHWAHRYVLKRELITDAANRRAMVIAVGGSKSIKMFESVRLTTKSYFDMLQMRYVGGLFVNKINAAAEIQKHPAALSEAHRLGKELVTALTLPKKPINIELT